ncbi:unnamed protein product [Allacma fusca]|uniref:Uncharacterized protein n=1 Tax=Allacma fusca TaxID=39272 RepID=A0A8J2KEL0_9HEXA|nr:unnamed protein product [Allacma fusca]
MINKDFFFEAAAYHFQLLSLPRDKVLDTTSGGLLFSRVRYSYCQQIQLSKVGGRRVDAEYPPTDVIYSERGKDVRAKPSNHEDPAPYSR